MGYPAANVSLRTRLIAVGAAAALAMTAFTGCGGPAAEAPPPIATTVGVVESRLASLPVEVEPNGTTRGLEQVTLRARVRGFLNERLFEEGSIVRKGQLLFVIDEEPYEVALTAARAHEEEATAELRKAEESKAREISAAELALDEAQLVLAQIQERRSRALVAREAGTAEDLDRAGAERKRWESQLDSDRANLEQAKTDFEVGIASARARLLAARAEVRVAELELGYCRVHAPITGRIGEALVKVGNLVGPDLGGGGAFTDLATIQQLDPIGVEVRISSRDLDRTTALVQAGLAVRLSRPGSSGPRDHPYEGRCYFIDNAVDETTSTFLLKAEVPNPEGKLLPGEYVKVRMVVDRLVDVVVVPASAVVESASGTVVNVVDGDGKVAVRTVDAGRTFEGMRVINRGLDAGATVIVDGLQKIRPGLSVLAEPAGPGPGDEPGTAITKAGHPGPPRS